MAKRGARRGTAGHGAAAAYRTRERAGLAAQVTRRSGPQGGACHPAPGALAPPLRADTISPGRMTPRGD
ncbi:hypothetical protein [Haloechinothrix alba]|uniref:hypothetical protein n=1 Tax=Haloechinothrix alba TaxID=664784 RepID=UPI001130C1EB|nr:hypothetical protein [Haloechinothrix alba]